MARTKEEQILAAISWLAEIPKTDPRRLGCVLVHNQLIKELHKRDRLAGLAFKQHYGNNPEEVYRGIQEIRDEMGDAIPKPIPSPPEKE